MLNLEFENKSFKKWLLDESPDYKTLNKKIDKNILKTLIKRKDQLLASSDFFSFCKTGLGKTHPLENTAGWYGIHLNANYRLIVKPVADDLSPESLSKCDTIILIGVEDYHGGKSNWIIP